MHIAFLRADRRSVRFHCCVNSTYFGWYRGDAIDYYQERRAAYGPRAETQPFTFTECVGSYLTAAGDTDVGGKNYACVTATTIL